MPERRKLIFYYLRSIILTTTFLILSTYFIFLPNHKNMAGALSFLNRMENVSFEELEGSLDLTYNYPVSDEMGLETAPYQFRVLNNGEEDTQYVITFTTGVDDTSIDASAIHYVIESKEGKTGEVMTLKEDGQIVKDTIESLTSTDYSLKFWISNDTDTMLDGKTFQGTIQLEVVR